MRRSILIRSAIAAVAAMLSIVPIRAAGDPWFAELIDSALDSGSNPWRSIIVHHSASPSGNLEQFDRLHRSKGWDCIGYHFVITNGRGGPDGELEISPRWWMQKHGAHAGALPRKVDPAHRNSFNEFGIGICLVGNFQKSRPTSRQISTLTDLIARLRDSFGIPSEQILGHRHVRGTACPGNQFPWKPVFARLGVANPLHLKGKRCSTTPKLCFWCRAQDPLPGDDLIPPAPPAPGTRSPDSSVLPDATQPPYGSAG